MRGTELLKFLSDALNVARRLLAEIDPRGGEGGGKALEAGALIADAHAAAATDGRLEQTRGRSLAGALGSAAEA